jgi:hypothetical protein
MAGKARDDMSPRTRQTVQVCLAEADVRQLKAVADAKFNGRLSVAARSLLRNQLSELIKA